MDAKKEKIELSAYQKNIHTFGRITNLIAMAALIGVPLAMSLLMGIKVDVQTTLKGFMGVGILMSILVVVEFMSYAPLLGAGATYLTFITGNTLNMKLPSAMSSVRIAGVEEGSKEAEVISTIAVAVSSLVTILILLFGLVGLSFVLPVLESPSLKPAFDNLMPALMGALGMPVLFKDLKTASLPVLLAVVLTLLMGYGGFSKIMSLLMPVFMAITLLWRLVLYKRELKRSTAA